MQQTEGRKSGESLALISAAVIVLCTAVTFIVSLFGGLKEGWWTNSLLLFCTALCSIAGYYEQKEKRLREEGKMAGIFTLISAAACMLASIGIFLKALASGFGVWWVVFLIMFCCSLGLIGSYCRQGRKKRAGKML